MSPDLQAGVTFEWRYTIPARVTKIAEGTHERVVILPERFNAKLAQKKARLLA